MPRSFRLKAAGMFEHEERGAGVTIRVLFTNIRARKVTPDFGLLGEVFRFLKTNQLPLNFVSDTFSM